MFLPHPSVWGAGRNPKEVPPCWFSWRPCNANTIRSQGEAFWGRGFIRSLLRGMNNKPQNILRSQNSLSYILLFIQSKRPIGRHYIPPRRLKWPFAVPRDWIMFYAIPNPTSSMFPTSSDPQNWKWSRCSKEVQIFQLFLFHTTRNERARIVHHFSHGDRV